MRRVMISLAVGVVLALASSMGTGLALRQTGFNCKTGDTLVAVTSSTQQYDKNNDGYVCLSSTSTKTFKVRYYDNHFF